MSKELLQIFNTTWHIFVWKQFCLHITSLQSCSRNILWSLGDRVGNPELCVHFVTNQLCSFRQYNIICALDFPSVKGTSYKYSHDRGVVNAKNIAQFWKVTMQKGIFWLNELLPWWNPHVNSHGLYAAQALFWALNGNFAIPRAWLE